MTRYYFDAEGGLYRTLRNDEALADGADCLTFDGQICVPGDEIDIEASGITLRDEMYPAQSATLDAMYIEGDECGPSYVRPLRSAAELRKLCCGVGTLRPYFQDGFLIQRKRLRPTHTGDMYRTTVRENGVLVGLLYQRGRQISAHFVDFDDKPTIIVCLDVMAEGPGFDREECIREMQDLG